MKKFLITTGVFPPDIGGPASYGKIMAQKLAPDNKTTVITYSKPLRQSGDKKFDFKIIRIWQGIPWGLRHILFFIRVLFLAGSQDAILTLNATSAGFLTAVASMLRGKKFFVKIVGDYAWETAINKKRTVYLMDDFQKFKRPGPSATFHKMQVWVCKKAEKVIVPSKYLADIVANWGINPAKIKVIYNGSDFKAASLSKEEARKKIGISGNIVLSVGRLVPWKGFRMLIKIMPQLLNISQFFRLVIVGDGPDRATLNAMVKNLGLDRKVYLVGKKSQEELSVFFAAADMFVLNTGYEGFSHKLLEAMIAGTPVITTAVGGNKEIIRQGENGFMVKYNDEFNIIEAIKTLSQMPELRDQFIQEGKKTAGDFNLERMFKETVKLLTNG